MSKTFSLEEFEPQLVATMEEADYQPSSDTPFRVAFIGDWSGRANRKLSASNEELANWRPLLVDRDNLDQLMARLGVKLHLSFTNDESQSLTINFNQLADFHPDSLFEQLEIFETLGRTRARLRNPKTFAEAAAEMRGWAGVTSSAKDQGQKKQDHEQKPAGPISSGSLLDQILEGGSAPAPLSPAQTVSPEIAELAEEAVKPYLSPDIEADQDELIAAVDARIAGDMNAILHHPDFQALESAWRALDFLVTRLETGTELKLYLLDISFEEFKADLRSEDVRATALYKLLVEQTVGTAGGIPWAMVAANYTFDFASGDPGLVEFISLIARESGAPFIAGATSHLLGCESLVETPDPDDWRLPLAAPIEEWWATITSLPSAAYVGFALPRFLLRLPYGKETEPTEEFDFEEMPATAGGKSSGKIHESYLWANPSFAVAYLLAGGFRNGGWDFRPSDYLDVEGLPLHVYERDGESEIKPCAEVLLTLRAAEKIIDRGLMPLLSMKDTDSIHLGRFQSIAGTRLRGPWA
jgi:type VI secretion system protein ImpC